MLSNSAKNICSYEKKNYHFRKYKSKKFYESSIGSYKTLISIIEKINKKNYDNNISIFDIAKRNFNHEQRLKKKEKNCLKSQLLDENKRNNFNSINNYEILSPMNKTLYLNKSTTTNIKDIEFKLTPFQKYRKEKIKTIKSQFEKPYFFIYNDFHKENLRRTKSYFSLYRSKNNKKIKDFTKSYSSNIHNKIQPKINFKSPKIKKKINLKEFIYSSNFGIKTFLNKNISLRQIINNQS